MSAYRTTILDCPHAEVARVVAGEKPSNVLVLYVRCMFAGERESQGKDDRFTYAELVSETIGMCDLEDVQDADPVAVRILEAADPAHLRGEKSPT